MDILEQKLASTPHFPQNKENRRKIDFDSSDWQIEAYIESKRAEFYEDWFKYLEDYE